VDNSQFCARREKRKRDCYLVPLLNRLASGGIDYVDKECVARHGGAEITDYIERFMNIEEVKKWYAPKDV